MNDFQVETYLLPSSKSHISKNMTHNFLAIKLRRQPPSRPPFLRNKKNFGVVSAGLFWGGLSKIKLRLPFFAS